MILTLEDLLSMGIVTIALFLLHLILEHYWKKPDQENTYTDHDDYDNNYL